MRVERNRLNPPVVLPGNTLLDTLCDDFLADYRTWAEVDPQRVELWEMIDLFMALLHTWTKVRLLRVHPRLAIVLHRLRTMSGPTA